MTGGHGNPNWNYEETLLVYELLLKHHPDQAPGPKSPEVKELSNFIRSLPYHEDQEKNEKFRNLNSIAMKLQNLNSALTGKGLSGANKLDTLIVEKFGEDRERVQKEAELIRQGFAELEHDPIDPEPEQDEGVSEGRVVSKLHSRRERKSQRTKKIKELRKTHEHLKCEMCGLEEKKEHGQYSESVFEVHHIVPLSEIEEGAKTRLSDLALLCACCHRLLHARIRKEGWHDSLKENPL